MAHRIISDDAFLATSLDLFRTYGFEGVSIKRLADATGLEKASLYYRFPGGKDEIAMAVANDVVRWFQENVFTPLQGPGPVRKRVTFAAERLREFYVGGTKACNSGCDASMDPGIRPDRKRERDDIRSGQVQGRRSDSPR